MVRSANFILVRSTASMSYICYVFFYFFFFGQIPILCFIFSIYAFMYWPRRLTVLNTNGWNSLRAIDVCSYIPWVNNSVSYFSKLRRFLQHSLPLSANNKRQENWSGCVSGNFSWFMLYLTRLTGSRVCNWNFNDAANKSIKEISNHFSPVVSTIPTNQFSAHFNYGYRVTRKYWFSINFIFTSDQNNDRAGWSKGTNISIRFKN